jgi:thiosulfate/3-mercaptopyruvate sulfurtransferase
VTPVIVEQDFVLSRLAGSTGSAEPPIVLVDVRWYLDGRDGRAAYEAGHLPGAVWVDLDRDLAGHGLPTTEGRHPLPTPDAFAAAMGALGIGDDTLVVAYDDTGGLTAGRLVVMLRMLGRDAAMLNGGMRTWTGPVESGWVQPADATFTARPWPTDRLVDADTTAAAAAAGTAVIDARPHERFTGEVAMIDPRPGHIPGARSAPWSAVLDADGRLLPVDRLRAHYGALGVSDEPQQGHTIAYCGSGVSACMNAVALEHAGFAPPRLYIASWSGWSADPHRPAALGD